MGMDFGKETKVANNKWVNGFGDFYANDLN